MPEILLEGSEENNRPRLQLIATIIAAVAYGFIICLFLQTLTLLIVNKKHSYTLTTRTILIIYVVVKFALSAASVIQDFVFVTSIAFTTVTTSSNIIKMNEPLFLPLTIFGADGFMVSLLVCCAQVLPSRINSSIYFLSSSCCSFGVALFYIRMLLCYIEWCYILP